MIFGPDFFLSATIIESMAVILFNGFATVFLLPMLLMDVVCFLPMALYHLLAGKARLRIISAALSGFFLWIIGFALMLGLIRLVEAFALELLYRTWSGLATAAVGVIHTLYSFVRYRKEMSDYYYANVLEKNLTAKQTQHYGNTRQALQSGEMDAKKTQNDRSMDHLTRRIAKEVMASRQELPDWSEGAHQETDIYFL
ncbi:MAG: hypothetical protein FWD25_09840 [Clostridia bacterium]|nr:hypothetical protein [Clostridia bacterium]